ncbi:MAG: tetratricopeptide repeat protein [Bacteroidetes bacterium]|nr:tetratricopeptide repeat protein [Bacteroidota bacterium]
MKKCLSIAVVLIIIVIPLFCGAQKQAPVKAKDSTKDNPKNKQGKDQIPPLRELCVLDYKTDFSTLADKYKEDLFPKSNAKSAIHFYRGISLLKQGMYVESIRDFKIARQDTNINRNMCNFFIALSYMQLHMKDSILSICGTTLNVPGQELMKPEYWNNAEFTKERVFISYILGTNQVLNKPTDTLLIDALYGFCTREDKFLEAYYNYGTYSYNLGRYKKSIDMLVKVHDLKPADDSLILLDLGYLYRLAGDNVQAMKSYNLLLGEYRSYMGYNNRGCLYAYMEKYGKALSDLSTAIRKNQQGIDAWCNRGLVYLKILDYKHSVSDFTTAVQLKPDFSDGYYYRGFALKATGDYANSVGDFTRALQLKK